jgi:hypothetical protein
MPRESERYEVWVDDFRRRSLDSVFDEKDLAVSIARKLFRERRLKSVAVEFVTPRRLRGEDRETVFAEDRGDERKSVALSGDFDGRVVCHDLDDLYDMRAVAIVGRVLRGYLEHQGITAIELLHDPQQAKRLNNYEMLRTRAISLIAAAQARENGLDVEERRTALESLCDDAAARMSKLFKKVRAVDLSKGLGHACPMDSYYDDTADRTFLLYAAMSQHVIGAKGWGHKLQRLLDLIDDSAPRFAVELIDRFIADLFRSTAAVRALTGEHKDLAPALVDLAHLGQGRLALGYDTSPAIAPLNELIRAGWLPVTTTTIIERLIRGLESSKLLIVEERGSAFDALCSIIEALRDGGDGLLGGDRMKAALDLRCSRLAQGEIDRRLDGVRKPAKRVALLIEFAGQVYGARSRGIVLENLETVIRTAADSGSLIARECPILEALEVLADWQRRIRVVAAIDQDAAAVSEALDHAAVRLLEERSLLDDLMADTASAMSRLEAMTALCRSEVRNFHRATEMVKRRVFEILRAPAFIAALAADGGSGQNRDARVRDLQDLLRESGVV